MPELIGQIDGPSGNVYTIGGLLGQNEVYDTYKCTLSDGRICFAKVAASSAMNGRLDREAYILAQVAEHAARVEASYAEKFPGSGPLNYHICFPEVEETFLFADKEGKRRVNIVSFFELTEHITDLAPMAYIGSRELTRVDPKTSAWMIGKMLKLLVFTHSIGLSLGNLSGEKILLQRDNHLVALLDFTSAVFTSDDRLDEELARAEIMQLAQAVFDVLGGDFALGTIPEDEQMPDDRYAVFLKSLADGKETSAKNAHKMHYSLIEEMWGKKYHPYTAYDLK